MKEFGLTRSPTIFKLAIEGKKMSMDGHVLLSAFRLLERTSPTMPGVEDLDGEIRQSLSALAIPHKRLQGKSIAVTAGSRGIANLKEIIRSACDWLKAQGARPFVIPAMGSHGGATAEGQRLILEEYGVTPEAVGAEIISDMSTVRLGETTEGFQVHMDRNAWAADGVLVINRIKPHTDFNGKIESGLLKMIAVGLGKRDGAQETHRWGRKYGNEHVIRSMASVVFSTGKILCGLGVVENEMHQVAIVRAALPEGIVAMEEETLPVARRMVPRVPFSECQILIVDEMGKNISGTGMDTKVIGRGVRPQPPDGPQFNLIYVRNLSAASDGNAIGVGLADAIHERLYRRIDLNKTYMNVRTSLNPLMARLPMYMPSDREALAYLLATIGTPGPDDQRIIWIQNTLALDRVAVSCSLVNGANVPPGWRVLPGEFAMNFDHEDNLVSPFSGANG